MSTSVFHMQQLRTHVTAPSQKLILLKEKRKEHILARVSLKMHVKYALPSMNLTATPWTAAFQNMQLALPVVPGKS